MHRRLGGDMSGEPYPDGVTPVIVKIGGAEYPVVFTLGRLRRLQEEIGAKTIGETLERVGSMDMSALLTALRIGIDSPDITAETIDGWELPINEMAGAISTALARALGERDLRPPPTLATQPPTALAE